jgi:hypothetical protein
MYIHTATYEHRQKCYLAFNSIHAKEKQSITFMNKCVFYPNHFGENSDELKKTTQVF